MYRWHQQTLWEDVGLGLVGIDLFENVLVERTDADDVAMMCQQSVNHLLLRRPDSLLEAWSNCCWGRPVKRHVEYVCNQSYPHSTSSPLSPLHTDILVYLTSRHICHCQLILHHTWGRPVKRHVEYVCNQRHPHSTSSPSLQLHTEFGLSTIETYLSLSTNSSSCMRTVSQTSRGICLQSPSSAFNILRCSDILSLVYLTSRYFHTGLMTKVPKRTKGLEETFLIIIMNTFIHQNCRVTDRERQYKQQTDTYIMQWQ